MQDQPNWWAGLFYYRATRKIIFVTHTCRPGPQIGHHARVHLSRPQQILPQVGSPKAMERLDNRPAHPKAIQAFHPHLSASAHVYFQVDIIAFATACR